MDGQQQWWRGDDLAALARRVAAVAILACLPVLSAIWWSEAPSDPWVRLGYPVLVVALGGFAWVLLRRPAWAVRASVASLVLLELWWGCVALGRVGAAPDAATAWLALMPTPLLDVMVCLVVGFLFQRTRTAFVHGAVYVALVTTGLAVAVHGKPGGSAVVWDTVRFGVYAAVVLTLLLALARAKEQLVAARELAHRDDLTGVANRRRLLAALAEAAATVTAEHPVGVVYVDLDHFKQVNDTRGHDVGDRALRLVAEVLGAETSGDDLLARVGGEEFVVVAPGRGAAAAAQMAERMRAGVAAAVETSIGVRVTASIGVTTLRPGESAAAVLRRVDALMYRAKADGRDRVRTTEPA